VLLDKRSGDGKNHHSADDHGGAHVAEEPEKACQRQQQHVGRVSSVAGEFLVNARPALRADDIRPNGAQLFRGIVVGQAIRRGRQLRCSRCGPGPTDQREFLTPDRAGAAGGGAWADTGAGN
jgi:hypothetical protein